MQITLTNVRLSFADIYTAKAVNDGDPRYSCSFLIDPSTKSGKKQIKSLEAAIENLTKKDLKLKKALPSDKVCLRDGDEKEYDGYEGMMFVSAANKKRPQVVDRSRDPVTEDDDQAPYSGCICNAVIRLWAQNNNYGKRINASLEVVQFVKDGESFGAPKVDVSDALPDLEEGDDDDLD